MKDELEGLENGVFEDCMKIKTLCNPRNKNSLEDTLGKFEKGIKLPFEVEFQTITDESISSINDQTKAALKIDFKHNPIKSDEIEFYEPFFKEDQENRELTILHELIHAHLFTKDEKWVSKCFNYVRKLRIEAHGINRKTRKSDFIYLFLNIPNEILAERFMKKMFPKKFHKRTDFYIKMSQERFHEMLYEKRKHVQGLEKVGYFFELFRLAFFRDLIDEDSSDRKKIEELYDMFKEKLFNFIDPKGFEFFKDVEKKLLDIRLEDLFIPEEDYFNFADFIWNL